VLPDPVEIAGLPFSQPVEYHIEPEIIPEPFSALDLVTFTLDARLLKRRKRKPALDSNQRKVVKAAFG